MQIQISKRELRGRLTSYVPIGRDNPARAETFVSELIDRLYDLADLPRGCPLNLRYEHWGIRRHVYRVYSIFYRVSEGRTEIIHILCGARDDEAWLYLDVCG